MMSRFRLLGFVQKSVSTNSTSTKFQQSKIPVADEFLNTYHHHHHQKNGGLSRLYTTGLHSWCTRGVSGADVRLPNTGAFLINKRYFHATAGLYQQSFYEILGVQKSATQDDIRNAFQALAKKWHPDTNKDNPSANRKFQEVREAFETLIDANKRAQYDKKNTKNTNGTGQTTYDSARTASGYAARYAYSCKFPKDANFRINGADIHIDATISLAQAYFGGSVAVPTLSGDVRIKIRNGVHTVLMKNKGFPTLYGSPRDFGDQYVHFRVVIPTYDSLNERQRAVMEEFANGSEFKYWLNLKPVVDIVTDPDYLIQFSLWLIFLMIFLI